MQQRQSAALVSGNFGTLQRQLCCMQRQSCLLPAALLQLSAAVSLRDMRHCDQTCLYPSPQINPPLSTVEPIKPRFNHGSTFLTFSVDDRLLSVDNSRRVIAVSENFNNISPSWFNSVTESLATEAPSPSPSPTFSCRNLGNVAPGGGGFRILGNSESIPVPFFFPSSTGGETAASRVPLSVLLQLLAVQHALGEPLNLNGDILDDLVVSNVVALECDGPEALSTMFLWWRLRAHTIYDPDLRPPTFHRVAPAAREPTDTISVVLKRNPSAEIEDERSGKRLKQKGVSKPVAAAAIPRKLRSRATSPEIKPPLRHSFQAKELFGVEQGLTHSINLLYTSGSYPHILQRLSGGNVEQSLVTVASGNVGSGSGTSKSRSGNLRWWWAIRDAINPVPRSRCRVAEYLTDPDSADAFCEFPSYKGGKEKSQNPF
ncbi:hypothetical protein B0H16DRAFT_1466647 [Mycena metata]|uniref:Uncharacterized protein n=1 Tax=Mycena metata TaxID=1033252 RepID=A0AAD7I6Z4_9AGAR|nr:hypothetical protein B0H16DRAFT_1466647 [Mycena metata]